MKFFIKSWLGNRDLVIGSRGFCAGGGNIIAYGEKNKAGDLRNNFFNPGVRNLSMGKKATMISELSLGMTLLTWNPKSLMRFICPMVESGQNVSKAGTTCPVNALMLRTA